jgi:hypothetical protein
MATQHEKPRYVVLKLESYEGDDTFLRCGNDSQDYLYAVVAVESDGTAEVVDSSYRTAAEALAAWPEAGSRTVDGSRTT